jgi:nucleotide-binding universal stress UspA family protein
MKKILVPTDFSIHALNAAKLAANIARKLDARIYFIHVVDMPSVDTGGIPGQSAGAIPGQGGGDIAEGIFILKKAKKDFKELLQQDFLKGLNIAEGIQFGGVYESTVKQAEKHGIDLIIMGTHGSSGAINDFFVGSNTDKIVRLSEIPVITVRDNIEEVDFKHIVFASDFDDGVETSFRQLTKIIDYFDAQVDLVRVITRDDFYYSAPMLAIMEKFAQDTGLKKYKCHVYAAETVQTGINEYAAQNKADMIATVTHGRRGLARLLNGSTTNEMIKTSPIPVLTIKTAKR